MSFNIRLRSCFLEDFTHFASQENFKKIAGGQVLECQDPVRKESFIAYFGSFHEGFENTWTVHSLVTVGKTDEREFVFTQLHYRSVTSQKCEWIFQQILNEKLYFQGISDSGTVRTLLQRQVRLHTDYMEEGGCGWSLRDLEAYIPLAPLSDPSVAIHY